MGPATFGIYLMHHSLLDLLRSGTVALDGRLPLLCILGVEVLTAFVISAAASLILMRIPFARAVIGS
ncbi:MAG TPA: hypothetical protein DDX89_04955 [Candidatus Omnitrophica bacterium]|nr:MAG: hypothetical protein A2Z92_06315 [Omnitrophica WOR_2 bacterium GWA2_63_20]OGX17616.1 MAG: hypothetical protein A2105_02920 [Omnitrophica WOR_2 bacterium GWF2_63_9]OGX31232.1 MAG: hypothetical protein A3E56_03070 [Omnitrophica WOR_2 bacterium RIFCSPHIGHO2_12_FULL_64_13]OGX36468.1 MAG: hypothetical protein A3B73_01155 [Omnitrophica WOR_2 bacterium RIFCSPHIGHO2_02_FULL_63_39]OGX44829.1 MAG: hypothetical protein A3I71_04180 [Omnitrophica WOR_2 bacterium RIFCSPLOWO2_02_FULL_63_16]OGX48060.1